MKELFLVFVDDFYYNERIFDLDNPLDMDNRLYHLYLMKKEFAKNGVALDTYSRAKVQGKADYGLIFFDIPANLKEVVSENADAPKFLILMESQVINRRNWDKDNHVYFRKIFTWNDSWVDGKKYIKYCYPTKVDLAINLSPEGRNKLCVMISGNKYVSHPLELYSERIKAIRWFERNHPEDFDLYGQGWDRRYFAGFFSKLNRISFLASLLREKFPSYGGVVKSKMEVLKGYKFSICYENAKEITGYITEKIIDCILVGTIPVYWGASNITDYVPEGVFVDRRKFRSYEELYDFLNRMPKEVYLEYFRNVSNFAKGSSIKKFSTEAFVSTVVSSVLKN